METLALAVYLDVVNFDYWNKKFAVLCAEEQYYACCEKTSVPVQTFLIQLKQKLRAPRHPLADRIEDLYEQTGADVEPSLDVIDEDYLTRDEFNLHKIIVAVTVPGKVREPENIYMYRTVF